MVVRDRCVFSQVPLGPGDIIPSIVNSVPEVIVLSSPAPEGVGKAIDLLKLLHGQAAHPAEELLIRKNVHVLVQLRCKVTWHLSTSVIVPVILRQMIHIVEDHTVPGVVFHGLFETHIKEHRTIERLCAGLFDDIKGKFQPLFLEHWNQVQEKNRKMFMAVPKGDENCHLPSGLTVFGPPVTSWPNLYVLGEELMNFIKTDFTHIDIEESPHIRQLLWTGEVRRIGEVLWKIRCCLNKIVTRIIAFRIICPIERGVFIRVQPDHMSNCFHILSQHDTSSLYHKEVCVGDAWSYIDEVETGRGEGEEEDESDQGAIGDPHHPLERRHLPWSCRQRGLRSQVELGATVQALNFHECTENPKRVAGSGRRSFGGEDQAGKGKRMQ